MQPAPRSTPPTGPPAPEGLSARTLAASRREAMRGRARRIRRSVLGLSLGIFTAAFMAVYVQLASGHDPALTAAARARAAATSSSQTASTSASTSSGSSEGTGASTSSESSESGSTESGSTESGSTESSPSAVTTSQS